MPNQHSKKTMKSRVLAFVRAHPETTTEDLRQSFGLRLDRAGMILMRLANEGYLRQEKIPGSRSKRWTALDAVEQAAFLAAKEPDDSRIDLPIIRSFVKEWTCTTKRNAFECYLFGAAA